MTRRAAIIVLDGVGIGEAPDAAQYGDVGSNTLGNLARAVKGMDLPNLQHVGLGNIASLAGVEPTESPQGAWGLMVPRSAGKDSTTGHWEIAGVHLARPWRLGQPDLQRSRSGHVHLLCQDSGSGHPNGSQCRIVVHLGGFPALGVCLRQ